MDTAAVTKLTGLRGQKLQHACERLGIGKTVQGRSRAFGLAEVMQLRLALTLHRDHDLDVRRAYAIARHVGHEAWLDVVLADTERRWLATARGEVRIVDDAGLLEVLKSAEEGWTVVSLSAIARQVFAAAAANVRVPA